jgi:Glycosyl transferase family 2
VNVGPFGDPTHTSLTGSSNQVPIRNRHSLEVTITPLSRTRADLHRNGIPEVDIAIPVHNEARQLRRSVTALRSYLDESFPLASVITVVDNASTDGTWPIALELSATLPAVRAIHLDAKGRGRALKAAWTSSRSPVVAYMDADLSTGLEALLPLVAPVFSGKCDLAVGTRRGPGAVVVRGTRRELISRCYNLLLRVTLASPTEDAQCGFKAMTRESARELLPFVVDDEWFFDTELLVTARRRDRRVLEVPVNWIDDLDSRVDVMSTALADLRGVWRMIRGGAWRRSHGVSDIEVPTSCLWRLSGIGVLRPLAVATVFALLAPLLGAVPASIAAVALCDLVTLAGTGEPRRPLDPPATRRRAAIVSTLLGIGCALTVAGLAGARALGATSLAAEVCAVAVATFAASIIRFCILRTWVVPATYRRDPATVPDQKDGHPARACEHETRDGTSR